MLKKFIVLILLLAAVVFGAGCITEADDAAGIYMLESTDITMNGEKSVKNIGDVNRFGDLTTPSDTVIELRDDGTLTYTTIHREAPTEGTWVPGEDTFEIPADSGEGETLVGTISDGVVTIHHKNQESGIEQIMILKKVPSSNAGMYKFVSSKKVINGEEIYLTIGDTDDYVGVVMTEDTDSIELREDGTLTYINAHRPVPTESTWTPGEDTFDIPGDDEGETLTGVIKGDTILMTCENSLTGLKVETVLKMA